MLIERGASMGRVRRRYDAAVLMGVPGSGKSYLGRQLQERAIGAYRELEPLLREKFGTGAEYRERVARYYDLWFAKIFPTYRFALTVTGDDAERACVAIRAFLGAGERR